MSTKPRCIKCPPALSAMTVCGTPCFSSSQAVKAAPWFRGRVSSTQTCTGTPRSKAAYTGDRAEPQSAKANQPALQWVSTFTGNFCSQPSPSLARSLLPLANFSSNWAPAWPMRLQKSASSSVTATASRRAATTTASTPPSPAKAASMTRCSLSTPTRKLTAVGRVLMSCSPATCTTSRNRSAPSVAASASLATVAAASRTARYIPKAAAQPMRPAPRKCMSLMATAICLTLVMSSMTNSCGKCRWSMICTVASLQSQMVRYHFPSTRISCRLGTR
mmetsp:Transcript_118171/g.329561  ORF Transcript_118171/g.329561 Transcript_118171/m.329561 type:complete len:276 (+) Transcript_118171:485-1312(+)